MSKLAEDIWKATWCSLITLVVIVGFLRYMNEDRWWEIDKITNSEEYENNPLVYYSVKGSDNDPLINAELIVKNTPQEKQEGNNGVFGNFLSGQVVSVRAFRGSQSIRSPSFRTRDREIRHLIFEIKDNELAYAGSHSRLRRISPPSLVVFNSGKEKDLFQLDILKEIENYRPLQEAEAKEDKKIALTQNAKKIGNSADLFFEKRKTNTARYEKQSYLVLPNPKSELICNDIDNFPGYVDPSANHFSFEIFSNFWQF